jgi:hypothetical protein
MDTTTAVIIVIAIFALIIVAAFLRYRQRGGAEINGPFGTKLKVQASNDPPPQMAGISAKGITSREGGVLAEETLGRGIEAENVDAKGDVLLSSSLSSQQTDRPPQIAEPFPILTLSAQALNAGGNITIQQFVGGQIPLAEQLGFFIKHIGIENIRASNFANAQFEAYSNIWKNLQALRLLGDDLWEEANKEILVRFAEQLRKTLTVARDGEIFFEEEDRETLLQILREFGGFRLGKLRLIEIRSKQEFEYYLEQGIINEGRVARQIEENYEYKVKYEALLEKIRISFKKRLSN